MFKPLNVECRELITEVKTYQVALECPDCKMGTLESNGEVLGNYYDHICSNCKRLKHILHKKYPHLTYRDKEI